MKKYSLPLEKLGIGFMPYLSLIVPVYNRPQEVQELLESLAAQVAVILKSLCRRWFDSTL